MTKVPQNFSMSVAFVALAFAALLVPARAQENPKHQEKNSPVSKQPTGKAFTAPQAAVDALCAAARKNDGSELLVVLGPDAKEILEWSSDPEEVAEGRRFFVQKYDKMHRLVKEPDDTVALYVGPENWPFPIPLVQYKGAWYFDADLGKQEILYRQCGRNEIEALDVSRALVDAEKEYFSVAHNFTYKFVSSGNSRDGLYWKSGDANSRSPVGPYLAHAGVTDSVENHQPFHGYFYRIVLVAPGAEGHGDSKTAASNGNAFVVEAFPAQYRSSGVMTFLMDENGNAYEKDLGPSTAPAALKINNLQPDSTWRKVE